MMLRYNGRTDIGSNRLASHLSIELAMPSNTCLTLRRAILNVTLLFGIGVIVTTRAHAQADEIQVYQGGLAPVGTFNITVHNNFTPKGIKSPAFPGAVTSDHSLNGVPEFAYGVTKWFELVVPRLSE